MRASSRFIALLIGFCAAHGVATDSLNTWNAWKTFKSFARATAEVPDQGVSVQLTTESEATDRLIFLRQELPATSDEWLVPEGGLVWEFTVLRKPHESQEDLEIWSFDFGSFDDFVDAVEQDENISRVFGREALRSRVYWEPNREDDA